MKKVVPVLAILTFMILMLYQPSFYLDSARRGFALFATTVLPGLFPFFFCSILLTKIGAVQSMSKICRRPIKFFFNSPPEGAYILTLSMLSGYPIGASITSELCEKNIISVKSAKTICAFASTSGPIFVLGTIGSAIFNNPAVGIIVITSHYLSAFFNGIIFRRRGKDDTTCTANSMLDSANALGESISKSTIGMLAVGGYIVLAGMLIDTLLLFNINTQILSVLPFEQGQPILSTLFGMIEMTRGSLECAKIGNIQLATALTSAIVSFGGLCIVMQSATFLSRCKIGFFSVFIRKFSQSIIAFVLAYIFSFALV